MKADLILYNIGTLVTSRELDKADFDNGMENIEILKNAYLAVADGKILEIGIGNIPENLKSEWTKLVDIEKKVVTPGIVDSHTHLVHYGSRSY